MELKVGDRVKWIGHCANPNYLPNPGTVVRVTDKRIIVKWDDHTNTRNMMLHNLEKIDG